MRAEQKEYIGGDGRLKATWEGSSIMDRQYSQKMPWQFSWQRNERTLRWTEGVRVHMIKGFAAKELGISEELMDRRLHELALLLPDLPAKVAVMKPKVVAALAADTHSLALKLVALKTIFPAANVATMVVKQPAILTQRTQQQLQDAANRLRELLPDFDIDWLVEQHPNITMEPDGFAETLQEAKRMQPKLNVAKALRTNPSMIFGFERRATMIPYDS